MATVTIELLPQPAQTEFNLRRWDELLDDPELARIEGRIETDRHGHIIMSPPPASGHGKLQARIAHLLQNLLPDGETLTECPISTADGVKAADIAWASEQSSSELGNRACFLHAPEICIEVLSPRNSVAEMKEKRALYFDAGAREVWFCSTSGGMTFYVREQQDPLENSRLCPEFPSQIKLKR